MVVPMIVVIPVTFVHLPAAVVVIVVWMAVVSTLVRRTLPAARNPVISAAIVAPVPIDPCKSGTRRRRAALIPYRRGRAPDIHMNLAKSRSYHTRRHNRTCYPLHFHHVLRSLPSIGCERSPYYDCTPMFISTDSYRFRRGVRAPITCRATISFPAAVAWVLSACIIPSTPYTSCKRNGSTGVPNCLPSEA